MGGGGVGGFTARLNLQVSWPRFEKVSELE